MPLKTVYIRNVPEDIHRRLKARAAIEGMSMSGYMRREIRKALDQPTRKEILERLAAQPVRRLRRPAAAVIRDERDSP